MPKVVSPRFEPRKTPLQARSTASVEAILEATVQVLLHDGMPKLTTTRIAHRAGVSVGTLYQYFPNKSALLQALLREHLDSVASAMENACAAVHGETLTNIAQAIASAFVQAKFRNIESSVALYAISDNVEGKRIAQGMHTRAGRAIAELLRATRHASFADPELVAATLLSAMAGVSRTMLERGVTRKTMASMERELNVMASAYLEASATNTLRPVAPRSPIHHQVSA